MRKNRQTAEKEISILTLDDDPIITSTIQAYFDRSGYQVDVENDPYRAIERVRENHYDILLLDFLMSPICGDQVVEEIRKFNREIFIILLTGHKSMAPPIKTIRQLDIQGYYEKSDRFDQLELLVESCVKSIWQIRVIREYQRSLSVVVDGLPAIYRLQNGEHISDGILDLAEKILPSRGSFIIWGDRKEHLKVWMRGDLPPLDYDSFMKEENWRDGDVTEKDGCLACRLTEDGKGTAGCLGFFLEKKAWEGKLPFLKILARQVSAAVNNSRLHAYVNEQNEKLTQAYMQIIETLRFVVELKDEETKGHSERVAALAAALAEELGMEKLEVESIRQAGLFHDIGKIDIPDAVLLKPEPLSDEEYAMIRQHPVTGEKLLSTFRPFAHMLPMVRGHHERYDGKGYPDRLAGEEIAMGARIISVADAFDAMVSNRPYRRGFSLDKAVGEIRDGCGGQFDPDVGQAFLSLLERLGREAFVRRFCAHTEEGSGGEER